MLTREEDAKVPAGMEDVHAPRHKQFNARGEQSKNLFRTLMLIV